MKTRFPALLIAFALLFAAGSAMAYTPPSYPVPDYSENATPYNTWDSEDWESTVISMEEKSVFGNYLSHYGWTLTDAGAVEPLSSSYAQYVLAEYADAFAQYKPDRRAAFWAPEGLYSGKIYPLSVFGYVDTIDISVYLTVEDQPKSPDDWDSKTVTGAVLDCRMHDGFARATGVPAFRKTYPIDTSPTVIRMDAAKYLAKHGKRPFNEIASYTFPGGQRVPKEKQRELSALFPWKTPKYDFLFIDRALSNGMLFGGAYGIIAQPVYAAIYARHGIPLTRGEVGSLFRDCYYSENVFRSGENHYVVDFYARWHRGYPDAEDPGSSQPDTWLTWLIVRPLSKEADIIPERYFYAADTPQSVIARDMENYFKGPAKGKSGPAAK